MNLLIIQARMGSTRLPGKVLKEMDGIVALDRCVQRCRAMKYVDEVVVATSDLGNDDILEDWCNQHGILSFRGSEQDVLDRYVCCAREHEAELVIRVTSDCPFVDYELGDRTIRQTVLEQTDYIFYPPRPLGLMVEAVPFRTLEEVHRISTEARHREHVTYYIREYRDRFRTIRAELPPIYHHPELRLTLDTPEDYRLLCTVAEHFAGDVLVPVPQIIEWLLANPDVAAINGSVKQKEVK